VLADIVLARGGLLSVQTNNVGQEVLRKPVLRCISRCLQHRNDIHKKMCLLKDWYELGMVEWRGMCA